MQKDLLIYFKNTPFLTVRCEYPFITSIKNFTIFLQIFEETHLSLWEKLWYCNKCLNWLQTMSKQTWARRSIFWNGAYSMYVDSAWITVFFIHVSLCYLTLYKFVGTITALHFPLMFGKKCRFNFEWDTIDLCLHKVIATVGFYWLFYKLSTLVLSCNFCKMF